MAISDKLTYLNETKTLLKNKINLTGANITTDTFRQYPTKLQNALLNCWNNEGEPIFTNWGTKVNGEGTNVKLDNTINARMKLTPKGNTSQTGTPTPTSPIPVNVVSGDNEVDIVGKNLFNGTGWRLVQSGNGFPQPGTGATIVSSDENNISFTSTYQTYAGVESGFIKVKANETYMLSVRVTTPTNRFFITQYDENKTRISTLNSANVSTLQNTSFITTNNGYISVAFTNTTTSPTTYKIEDIQIEKGPIATTYEPYTSQNYTISLGDTELCKIGTYQDYIYKDNGSWYLHKEVGKVVLNGSESWATWYQTSNSNIGFYYSMSGLAKIGVESDYNGALRCDKFSEAQTRYDIYIGTSEAIKQCGGTGNQYIALGIAKTKLSDWSTNANAVASLKTWLSSNNAITYYVLATPTDIEITNTTLISQLETLKGAMSYEGQTNINGGFMIVGASALGNL